jgi:hypothetical protein
MTPRHRGDVALKDMESRRFLRPSSPAAPGLLDFADVF